MEKASNTTSNVQMDTGCYRKNNFCAFTVEEQMSFSV